MRNDQAWEKKQALKERASELRKKATPQEKRLWKMLRQKKLGGHYFRRQYVIGPFIADFCCVKARVVVEVEGLVHIRQQEYDAHREAWLREHGYAVLRFSNDQVEKDLEGVLSEILCACEAQKGPPPRRD
jgi:very-short-patch-repair endonuclease